MNQIPSALPPNAYLFIPALLNLALLALFLIGVPLLVVQLIRWASQKDNNKP